MPPPQDSDVARWMLDRQVMNTNAVLCAHVRSMASMCAARSLQEGLRPRRLPRAFDLADTCVVYILTEDACSRSLSPSTGSGDQRYSEALDARGLGNATLVRALPWWRIM